MISAGGSSFWAAVTVFVFSSHSACNFSNSPEVVLNHSPGTRSSMRDVVFNFSTRSFRYLALAASFSHSKMISSKPSLLSGIENLANELESTLGARSLTRTGLKHIAFSSSVSSATGIGSSGSSSSSSTLGSSLASSVLGSSLAASLVSSPFVASSFFSPSASVFLASSAAFLALASSSFLALASSSLFFLSSSAFFLFSASSFCFSLKAFCFAFSAFLLFHSSSSFACFCSSMVLCTFSTNAFGGLPTITLATLVNLSELNFFRFAARSSAHRFCFTSMST
mmetsp:Transcript_4810/g.12692  ORF Transcript_4810/g.12692 Transcript_4810/m.12692 type:complete len:282 (+) Transcript_4810:138-983(+)